MYSGNESREDDVYVTMKVDMAREDYVYKVLSAEEISKYMDACIKEVNAIVEIPAAIARILLNHFKWDKEKFIERFYDSDLDYLFSEVRVINPFKEAIIQQPEEPKQLSTSGTEECEICFLDQSISMTGLECGHKYCAQCWCEYLTTKIMEEGLGQTIVCPGNKCDILVDDATVMRLVSDSHVKSKYQHIITNSFVECNRLLRWCPSPGCGNAIKVEYVEAAPVTCECGHTFCFACGENWHDPVRCTPLKKWIKRSRINVPLKRTSSKNPLANTMEGNKPEASTSDSDIIVKKNGDKQNIDGDVGLFMKEKCNDDSETFNWITVNTKECPKCYLTIEKSGGCNHMMCKNENCKAEFCWVCLNPWREHRNMEYHCNRYVSDDKVKPARDALKRYLFYCNRHMNHMQSLRLESKLYSSIMQKIDEMRQHNKSWSEVQFLKKGVDVLFQCRQTLMYTYVFAYYLRKNNQSMIFEDNQADLELAIESLAKYLTKGIAIENLDGIREKFQNTYRYCDSRRKVLLEHVHEGYEKGIWDFIE